MLILLNYKYQKINYMPTAVRLERQWQLYQKNPHPNIKVQRDYANPYLWFASIDGPLNTPYEGGRWLLQIDFPDNHPFKPPLIKFINQIYHPGVWKDGYFHCCYASFLSLSQDKWIPTMTIHRILQKILLILQESQIQKLCICRSDVPEVHNFNKHRQEYRKEAKQWILKYAKQKYFEKDSNQSKIGVVPQQNSCSHCHIVILPEEIDTALKCAHKFHIKCLQKLCQNKCPQCQQQS